MHHFNGTAGISGKRPILASTCLIDEDAKQRSDTLPGSEQAVTHGLVKAVRLTFGWRKQLLQSSIDLASEGTDTAQHPWAVSFQTLCKRIYLVHPP